jgi:hypothetical protein
MSEKITKETAQNFAADWDPEVPDDVLYDGCTNIYDCTEITNTAAEILGGFEFNYGGKNFAASGYIWLRITKLQDSAALHLSNCRGCLLLEELRELSDVAAEHLSRMKKNKLGLTLDNLPASAAKILRDAGHR